MHACKVTATSRLPPWRPGQQKDARPRFTVVATGRQSSRRTLFLCSSGSSDSVIQTKAGSLRAARIRSLRSNDAKVRVNGTPRSAGGGLRRC